MKNDSVSLSHLITDIKITLQSRYEKAVWVIAEISDYNLNRSGHCYMELIEKDSVSDKIIAKCRATIWAFTFRTIKAYFESTTSETLRAGLKVLFKASIEFHEVYGFSLNIQDIDPQYTLGDLARKKALIIKQLDDEGVLDMNKSLSFPLVPQRIAVISSETAAGYGDFTNQLKNNQEGFGFKTELFPAIMQGDKAPESIINALEEIYNRINEFDLVAIMRGGGSKSDLSCFDDYDLAYFITQFPLPVITGIGHDRDDSVTDIVAHTKLKTPTAVAEFLVDCAGLFKQKLDGYEELLLDLSNDFFENHEYNIEKLGQRLQNGSSNLMQKNMERMVWLNSNFIGVVKEYQLKQQNKLESFKKDIALSSRAYLQQEIRLCEIRQQRLSRWLNNYFSRKERKLNFLQEKNELLNPQSILERGFAWVKHNDQIIKDSQQLKKGDQIEITLAIGKVEGQVKKVKR